MAACFALKRRIPAFKAGMHGGIVKVKQIIGAQSKNKEVAPKVIKHLSKKYKTERVYDYW